MSFLLHGSEPKLEKHVLRDRGGTWGKCHKCDNNTVFAESAHHNALLKNTTYKGTLDNAENTMVHLGTSILATATKVHIKTVAYASRHNSSCH